MAKKPKLFHTSSSQRGMGDFYGTGIRNPIGTVGKESYSVASPPKKGLNKPPKSLA